MNSSPILKRPDYLVCTCMEVMYSTIVQSIHQGTDSLEKLSDLLGIGTGCSSCVAEVYSILEEEKRISKK